MLFLVKNVLLSSIHKMRCDLDSIKALSCPREETLPLRESQVVLLHFSCQTDLWKPQDLSRSQGCLGSSYTSLSSNRRVEENKV